MDKIMPDKTPAGFSFKLPFAISCLIFLGACIATMIDRPEEMLVMHFDGPTFESVEALAASSDEVAEIRIERVVARTIDFGDEGQTSSEVDDGELVHHAGVPLAIYEAKVAKSYSPNLRRNQKILLAMLDEEVVLSESVVKLDRKSRYITFLQKVESSTIANLDLGYRDLYITLNDENGVLEILDQQNVKFNERVKGLSEAQAMAGSMAVTESLSAEVEEQYRSEALTVDLQDVEQQIVAAKGR